MYGIESCISNDLSNVVVTLYEENGRVTRKTTTFEGYLAFLNQAMSTEHSLKSIPALPYGYYAGAIGNEGDFDIVITMPAKKTAFNYFGEAKIIPMPSLCFKYQVRAGRLQSTKCFALDTDNPSDGSELYSYPFGNVSTYGDVCWGRNVIPNLNEPKELDKITELFYSSDSNDDYWHVGSHIKPCGKISTLGKFLNFLSNKEEFPKKLLVATNLKLGSLR